MCKFLSLINTGISSKVVSLYSTDDLVLDLSSVLGAAVKYDTTASVSFGLIQTNTVLTNFVDVVDGLNENDFANGVVCGVIDNADLDSLPRGNYKVIIRVEAIVGSTSTQKTILLPITVNLKELV